MRKLTLLLLAFLALVGCRTKKVETHTQRQIQKEHFIHYKDSTQLFAYQAHKTDLSEQSDQSFELELEPSPIVQATPVNSSTPVFVMAIARP